jgi:hypothetical protein
MVKKLLVVLCGSLSKTLETLDTLQSAKLQVSFIFSLKFYMSFVLSKDREHRNTCGVYENSVIARDYFRLN